LLYRNLRETERLRTSRRQPGRGSHGNGLPWSRDRGSRWQWSAEIVIVNMNDVPCLLKNLGSVQNALAVRLTNRSAMNARITVEAGGHRQMSEVMSGGSYSSHSFLTRYFGLGKVTSVDRLEVRWPNGDVQQWSALPVNRTISLTEGQPQIAEQPLSLRTTAAPPPAHTPKKP
jgi:hypothetical protein